MEKSLLSPTEIIESTIEVGMKKVRRNTSQMFLLGVLAGIFIAFGGYLSTVVIHDFPIASNGLKSLLQGAIFPVGLILVVVAGAELFTGNNLIFIGALEGKVSKSELLKNWGLIYFGNFVGSVVFAWLIYQAGLFNTSGGELGAAHVSIAAGKASLTFGQAFFQGVLCNIAVCLAVWMAIGAKDMVGKSIAAWVPVMAFVTGSFEHSIANMYYFPAAIMARQEAAVAAIIGSEGLAGVSWTGLLYNLVPVTLGNIVGGAFLVGGAYWLVFLRKPKTIKRKLKRIRKTA